MDNSSTITSRFRNKFWFVFFALFVFWYLILYGFDWSSISGLTSSLPSSVNHALQEKPNIQSVIPAQEEQLSNYNIDPEEQERVANATIFSIEETSANFSGDNETEKEEVIEDDEEQDVMQEIGDLEKEFEPDDESEGEKSTCNGRYIYVHELPSRFNQDLLKQCRLLNKWADMCQYLSNNGLGTDFGNSGRVFSKTCWFNTNQFSLEVIFHNRMKQYGCLTNDSSKAAAVFVPYYAGFDVSRYLWGSNSTIRDADSLDLAEWLRGKPEWKRMSGRDHFMVAGRITWDFRRGVDEDYAWGNKLMLLPEMKNMTILTIESSPWNRNDFAIPYPTYFHPWNDNDVVNWQNRMKKQRRKTLFCFAGGPRPDMPDSIRAQIIDQCKSAKRKCALMECPTNSKNKCQKPEQIMKMFQNSIFCLQPPGDSFTRRSTFDAILAGCIPVFFTPASAYVQYLWHLPKDYKKYSVLIPEEDVKNKAVSIENVLSRIPKSRVYAMREAVIRMIPHVVYADPRSRMKKHQDAFDLTTKGVIERVQSLRKEKDPRYSFEEEASWKYYTFGMVGKHEWDHYFLRTDKANY